MYEGRPILKKVKHTNLHNPSLNSQAMKGVFYETKAPPLIRDELRYNCGFKDSLQQTMELEEHKRRQLPSIPKELSEQRPSATSLYESQRMRNTRQEVVKKVTEMPMQRAPEQINYRGYRNIKTKQNHGFDIIKNF